MDLSGSSTNSGHESKRNLHAPRGIGCNELGVGRSLKLGDLQLCVCGTKRASVGATNVWQRTVRARRGSIKPNKKSWPAEGKEKG